MAEEEREDSDDVVLQAIDAAAEALQMASDASWDLAAKYKKAGNSGLAKMCERNAKRSQAYAGIIRHKVRPAFEKPAGGTPEAPREGEERIAPLDSGGEGQVPGADVR